MVADKPTPSPADDNGRDSSGRFTPGNRHGKGNPHARKAQVLRSALMDAVGEDDLRAIVRTLIEAAKAGDVAAARLLFDRVLGKTPDPTLLDLRDLLAERRVDVMEDTAADKQMRLFK